MASSNNGTRHVNGIKLGPAASSDIKHDVCSGIPKSGTSGDGAGYMGKGSTLFDYTNGTSWQNTGSKASPYWEPMSPIGAVGPLWGYRTTFEDGVAAALASTATFALLAGGFRIFGQGIDETDAGAVMNAAGEGPNSTRFTTTDEAAHVIALGGQLVTSSGQYQPDTHGRAIFDVEATQATALTLRAFFAGFLGISPDALDPPISIATTVITLVQDDLFGVCFDAAATAATELYVAHNKSDAAPTQSVATGGRDTGVVVPTAGTYQRYRVEIDADGGGRVFLDKVQVFSAAAMVDVDEELNPVICLVSNSAAVKSMDIKRAYFCAMRP